MKEKWAFSWFDRLFGRKKILTGYEIWEADTRTALVGLMMEKIKRGWEPIGGVAYDDSKFYQAAVRYYVPGKDHQSAVIKSV